MKALLEEGKTYREIAKRFNISITTVIYWIKPEYRINHINRGINRWKNLTKEQKKKSYEKKTKGYMSRYIKNRYHSDPEFRKKFIQNVINYQQRRKGILV